MIQYAVDGVQEFPYDGDQGDHLTLAAGAQVLTKGAQVAAHKAKWYVEVIMKNPSGSKSPSRFHVVVEAADRLAVEEQETLITVLNQRLADRRRADLAADIREAQKEFERGVLRPTTPDEIMKEILS